MADIKDMMKRIEDVKKWAAGPIHMGESAQPKLEPICNALLLLSSEIENLKKALFRSIISNIPGMTEEKLDKIMEIIEEGTTSTAEAVITKTGKIT